MRKPGAYMGWVLRAVILGDLLVVAGSLWLAYWARFGSSWMGSFQPDAARLRMYLLATPVILAVFWVTFKVTGLYRQRRGIYAVEELERIFWSGLLAMALLLVLAFFVRSFNFSIKVFVVMALFGLPGLFFWRGFARLVQVRFRRKGYGQRRVVILGTGSTARRLAGIMQAQPGLGYRLLGMVRESERRGRPRQLAGLPVLGSLPDLKALVAKAGADMLMVALPASHQAALAKLLFDTELPGVELRIVSNVFSLISSPLAVDEVLGVQVFALKRAPLDRRLNRALKRGFDLALVLPGLVMLAPLMLALALAVKLGSPGPVFYSQERMARGGRRFKILKFRSMRVDAEAECGPVWARKDDPRRTPLGVILRRWSLDELPQLFNVLAGQMSLVGPRPERPVFVRKFAKRIPRYLKRHQVQAGITGWAQVNGLRGDTSIEERTRYDIYYVENWSLAMDAIILIRTLLELFEQPTAY